MSFPYIAGCGAAGERHRLGTRLLVSVLYIAGLRLKHVARVNAGSGELVFQSRTSRGCR
jgi:hypothetical protein